MSSRSNKCRMATASQGRTAVDFSLLPIPFAVLIALYPLPVLAADWFDPASWQNGVVPTASDVALVQNPVELRGRAEAMRVAVEFGSLDVSGSGTSLQTTQFDVGMNGYGTATLGDSASINTFVLDIGASLSSRGEFTVGGGAKLNVTGWANISQSGRAIMRVQSGAEVTVGMTRIANLSAGTGTLSVDGKDTKWTNTGEMYVGTSSPGLLTVDAGATLITQNKTLIGNQWSGVGDVYVRGQRTSWTSLDDISVGGVGKGTVTLAGGARLKSPELLLARDAPSFGTLTIGAQAGSAPVVGGVVEVDRIRFGAGTGRLVFNMTGPPLVYAGTIEGGGAVDVLAGDVVLTGASGVDADPARNPRVNLAGGSLTVNGKLGGAIDVAAGAVLRGTGQVGATALASKAVLAPGNSLGTLTINGDLRFSPGSVYQVEVAPGGGASDRVVVAGTAHLAGSVVHIGTDGNYAPYQTYTILSAGQIQGRFDGAASNYAYLTPSLDYTATAVTLALQRKQVPPVVGPVDRPGTDPDDGKLPLRPIRFADLVSGRNPTATANAIDSMPITHEVYRNALGLPEGAPQAFFTNLSGEIHANAQSALLGLSGQARNVPLSRLRANLNADSRPGAPTAALGLSNAAQAPSSLPSASAHPAWVQLVGNWQRLGPTDEASAVRLHTGGVFVGADAAVSSGWRLGGALGYTDSNVRTDGVDAKTGISSYSGIVYGGKALNAGPGKFNLMVGAGYTWHDINTERRIAAGSLAQTLRADYGASTVQVFTELGYALPASASLTVEPYAGVAWATQHSRGFNERGGSAALSGTSQTSNTTTSTLGMRARQTLTQGPFRGTLSAGVGWRHAFGDVRPVSTLAFDAGDAFTIAGAPIARNAALLEAGLQAAAGRNATVGISYTGQFGGGNQDHSATLAWRWAY